MDENELIKTGMEVALRPVTDIAENALGLLGGDWLSEKRARNREKLKARTREINAKRGVSPDDDPSPSVVIPLLSAAQDESREEVLEFWAQLLASAMDPDRQASYRREFVGIVKELEPADAIILPMINTTTHLKPTRREFIERTLQMHPDVIELSIKNLVRLGLAHINELGDRAVFPITTALGRQFMASVSD